MENITPGMTGEREEGQDKGKIIMIATVLRKNLRRLVYDMIDLYAAVLSRAKLY